MNTFGENVRSRRQELGMSQQELADKMGYSTRSTINKIELGINDVTQSKVIAFAKSLKTTASFLMGWDSADGAKQADAVSEALKIVDWIESIGYEVFFSILPGCQDLTNPFQLLISSDGIAFFEMNAQEVSELKIELQNFLAFKMCEFTKTAKAFPLSKKEIEKTRNAKLSKRHP